MAVPSAVTKMAWPMAKKAAAQIAVLIASNPQVREQLGGLGKKLGDVQKARTPESKITSAMDSVREQADLVLAAERERGSHESVASVQATGWKQRAEQVERALSILQHQPRAARKPQLARVAAMADSLVAEVLTTLIDDAVADSPTGSIEGS